MSSSFNYLVYTKWIKCNQYKKHPITPMHCAITAIIEREGEGGAREEERDRDREREGAMDREEGRKVGLVNKKKEKQYRASRADYFVKITGRN